MHAGNFLLYRVSWNPEQALKTYFMGGIRNPRTLEIENFMDIKTLDDFWNWHQLNFCQDLIFVCTLSRISRFGGESVSMSILVPIFASI